ncbi:MAG: hypothetical protein HZB40_06275 [Rhodocyclales bacterium]|nr:hypothetical protein [Rhodocyclales bacterium]
MLALKLLLVPAMLGLVSLAARWWGPAIAGWLAGLPLVAGPILFVIALEQGPAFAARAATAAAAAISASILFGAAYSHCAWRSRWPLALAGGLCAWFAAAALLARLPPSLPLACTLAALICVPRLFPQPGQLALTRAMGRLELGLRMLAGAVLTLAVTGAAAAVGPAWSGLLAVFPVLGTVLAVFSHRGHGAGHATLVLRSMATGQYSFVFFCAVLAVMLTRTSLLAAFAAAIAVALAALAASRRLLR